VTSRHCWRFFIQCGRFTWICTPGSGLEMKHFRLMLFLIASEVTVDGPEVLELLVGQVFAVFPVEDVISADVIADVIYVLWACCRHGPGKFQRARKLTHRMTRQGMAD
jgi:hypothetical protein